MRRPLRLPLLAFGLTALGVGALVLAARAAIEGPFVGPLDDASIHLGLARELARDGTWGLNPGEHASASSSPLWTLLLAGLFATFGANEALAYLLATLAALPLLLVAAAGLRDEGASERAVALGLGLLVLLTPLPFLSALGMEHALHAALALALVRRSEAAPSARATAGVALLAALATLTRFESVALALWISASSLRDRGPRALAALGGALVAVLGFGAYSLSRGSLPLPNSVLLKAVADRDPWASLGTAFAEGAPLLALAVAVTVGAAALDTPATHRRRVALYGLTVLSQLALGRVGWLYRYEAWLVAWGLLLAVTPGRLLLARGGAGALLPATLLLLPLGWRATQANLRYPVGARLQSDVDLALARWVAEALPRETIAAQDVGALSFVSDATLVDVTGLGTDAVARDRLRGRRDAASMEAIFRARGVSLAITGRDWLGGAQPASFEELAQLWAPFPEGPGEFETVIWLVDPAARGRILAALDALEASLSPRARLVRAGGVPLDLDEVSLSGAAVQREPDRIALYTNGALAFTAPAAGELRLRLGGTLAEGRGPEVQVLLEAGPRSLRVGAEPRLHALGPVEAGERVRIVYEDDRVGPGGEDRNLFVLGIEVLPPRGVAPSRVSDG